MKFAASSLLLFESTLEEQLEMLRDLGYDGLELAVHEPHGGARDTPRDPVTPATLAGAIPRLLRLTAGAGVSLAALDSEVELTEPDGFAPLAAAAEALGAPMVCVRAPALAGRPFEEVFEQAVAGLVRIEEAARRHHVQAVVETRPGTIAPSASAVRRLLEGFDAQTVGALFAPGRLIREGHEDWSLALGVLGPYLAHARASNALWVLKDKPAGGPWQWAAHPARLREGAADWRTILAGLGAAGYEGALTVDDDTDQPAREKLEDALVYLKEQAAPHAASA